MCYPEDDDHPGDRLLSDYFGMRAFLPYEEYVEFMLPYGEWIRLFRANGLLIEDLVEIRPEAHAVSSYRDDVDRDPGTGAGQASRSGELRKTG